MNRALGHIAGLLAFLLIVVIFTRGGPSISVLVFGGDNERYVRDLEAGLNIVGFLLGIFVWRKMAAAFNKDIGPKELPENSSASTQVADGRKGISLMWLAVKGVVGFLLLATLLYVFLANFSSVKSKFECVGEMTVLGGKGPSTVFIELDKYRWFVGLWSDSEGLLTLEVPNRTYEAYLHLIASGSQLQIYRKYRHGNELKGNFSTLSRTLALDTPVGFFDGRCVKSN